MNVAQAQILEDIGAVIYYNAISNIVAWVLYGEDLIVFEKKYVADKYVLSQYLQVISHLLQQSHSTFLCTCSISFFPVMNIPAKLNYQLQAEGTTYTKPFPDIFADVHAHSGCCDHMGIS